MSGMDRDGMDGDRVVSHDGTERMDERLEESASQLSAMFDGELSAAECELLSRRLARDEALRARWARYALVGAAMRSEPIATASGGFARRVGAAIDRDVSGANEAAPKSFRWLRTLALGGTLAAGVAAMSVFLLRNQILAQEETLSAAAPTEQPVDVVATVAAAGSTDLLLSSNDEPASYGEPASYVVPRGVSGGSSPVPVSLANYMVAHSEYSSPLARRGLLSVLVGRVGGQIVDAPPAAVIIDEGADAAH